MTDAVIERLNLRGEGVAEGLPPIPRVLPGEEVSVSPEKLQILTPSEHRVSPPCRHYKACGACAMQHASDSFVADWKTSVIAQGLSAQGLTTRIRPILTSPPASRRRATLHGRRTKKGAMVGFMARASDVLVDVPDCQVLHPAILAATSALEAFTRLTATRTAGVDLAVTVSEAGLDLRITGGRAADRGLLAELAQLAGQHGLARLTYGDEPIATREPPAQRFGPARVVPPPGAFLQATAHGEATLLAAVQEAIGPEQSLVADLFAGCGTFSLPLARDVEVEAYEGDAALTAALDAGWRSTGGTLRRTTAHTRDLFRQPLLPDELARYGAVVIDPPRAGAEAQHRALATSSVPRIAAVSCNPVTFARDARILTEGGYRLDWVQPVDQFRWSSHVELAAQFTQA
ncbi:class I SAM-dependent RNA methyltransferase [Oceanicola sp. 502str15]|uniref:class I SAM-dependent RNA methyltransferase n=1 Tax=Oceanicola sp. 502str15 TaxID=2696061 RepID=UPI002094EE07|nr:class I SAM-dependent RNA methyltransferase [Oceanicola sp. 502str15]MCO6384368.1 class I SAM-dependent RNA methyltransferase [Oceanicola sp. 502str15]